MAERTKTKERRMIMKKILFLIGILASMLFTTTAFAIKGEGTEESPFLITNQEELMLINDFPDCHFKLMNDIDLEGELVMTLNNSNRFVGVFDGNGKTISNFSCTGGMFGYNSGIIKNLNVITNENGVKGGVLAYSNYGEISDCMIFGTVKPNGYEHNGGVVRYNNYKGIIQRVSFEGDVSGINDFRAGGIAGSNGGIIRYATVKGNISSVGQGKASAGGIVGDAYSGSEVSNSYFLGTLKGWNTTGGIVGYADAENIKITNCYSSAKQSTGAKGCEDYNYGIVYRYFYADYSPVVTNSFYDTTVSGISDDVRGTPKTTLAMKMKKTYTDAGWDFENIWGIDENINDGYPYLLWEYAETASASAEITSASSTPTSLKFISTVATEGEPEIATFGTTFIPLWLFETGSSDVATVEYNNAEHNIQNGQTFGATLGGIPEAAKDMVIVGKSFVKDADGNYTWSAAKSASVNNPTLNTVE